MGLWPSWIGCHLYEHAAVPQSVSTRNGATLISLQPHMRIRNFLVAIDLTGLGVLHIDAPGGCGGLDAFYRDLPQAPMAMWLANDEGGPRESRSTLTFLQAGQHRAVSALPRKRCR